MPGLELSCYTSSCWLQTNLDVHHPPTGPLIGSMITVVNTVCVCKSHPQKADSSSQIETLLGRRSAWLWRFIPVRAVIAASIRPGLQLFHYGLNVRGPFVFCNRHPGKREKGFSKVTAETHILTLIQLKVVSNFLLNALAKFLAQDDEGRI